MARQGEGTVKSHQIEIPPDFMRFWQQYPRRVARLAALKAWRQLNPPPLLVDEMLAALAWQRTQQQWRDLKFVPHAATWLRAERWTDEPPELPVKEIWECRHTETCAHPAMCRIKTACGPERYPLRGNTE